MPVTASDVWYENAFGEGEDFSTYGTLSGNQIITNVAGELFNKLEANLFVNGGVKRKKGHLRIGATDPVNVYVGLSKYTSVPSGVVVALHSGATQNNGINDVASAPMVVGTLNAAVNNGATSVTVALAGNKTLSYYSGWVNGEVLALYPVSGPVYLVTTGTPTQVTPPNIYQFNLASAYSGATIPAGTQVSQTYRTTSPMSPDIIVNNFSSVTLNTASITIGARGIVQDTLTLTFTSAVDFTVQSTVFGMLPPGATTINTTIVNPTSGETILTIPSSAWSGSAVSGETITIDTVPSAVAFFLGIDVPAGTTQAGVVFELTHDVL